MKSGLARRVFVRTQTRFNKTKLWVPPALTFLRHFGLRQLEVPYEAANSRGHRILS
jgi:hypothetical protein